MRKILIIMTICSIVCAGCAGKRYAIDSSDAIYAKTTAERIYSDGEQLFREFNAVASESQKIRLARFVTELNTLIDFILYSLTIEDDTLKTILQISQVVL